MASIRQRTWESGGKTQFRWVVDYFDQTGKRRLKTFKTKKAADSWATDTLYQVKAGTHTPESASVTVKEAGERWIEQARHDGLERSTVTQYRQHLDLHISPLIGAKKLSRVTVPMVKDFQRLLSEKGRSSQMVTKITRSLGSILSEAQENGLVSQNVVREMQQRKRHQRGQAKRHKRKLEIGKDIPDKDEIRAILATAQGRWRPFVVTALFTGMRASELRGLTWANVDLEARTLTVRQRADKWNDIGSPKSEAGEREIPLAPMVVNTLKEWKLSCPRRNRTEDQPGELHYVFPNGLGRVESVGDLEGVLDAEGVDVDHHRRQPRLTHHRGVVGDHVLLGGDEEHIHLPGLVPLGAQDLDVEAVSVVPPVVEGTRRDHRERTPDTDPRTEWTAEAPERDARIAIGDGARCERRTQDQPATREPSGRAAEVNRHVG